MFEADYFFEGAQRWNLWFANPNHAGAFIAGCLPVCWLVHRWIGRSFSVWRTGGMVAMFALEVLGWWALAHTGSRGGLLAAVFALAVFVFVHRRALTRHHGAVLAARAAILVVFWMLAGFAGRTTPDFVAQDKSVGNRLTLWRGGLQMIAASPWQGWGRGESGEMYEAYFQPLSDTVRYKSMVNSYLTVAVEQGLLVFTLGLLPLVYAVVVAWKMMSEEESVRWLPGVCLSMLTAFAMTQVWSNLWIVPALWIAPMAAVVLIMGMNVRRGFSWGEFRLSAVAVIATSLALLTVGWWLTINPEVRREPHGWVSLQTQAAGKRLALYVDSAVLGDTAGKECRRLALLSGIGIVSVGHLPEKGADAVLLCGDKAAMMEQFKQPIWLIHPLGKPPDLDASYGSVLFLPEYTMSFSDEAWRKYAMERGMPIVISSGVGQDIRSTWPDVLLTAELK